MSDITSIQKEMERKRIERDIKEYLRRGKKITKVPPGSVTDDGSALSARRRLWKQE